MKRRMLEFLAAVFIMTGAGFLFYFLSGLSYRTRGTVGELSTLNITFSVAYTILLAVLMLQAGRRTWRGAVFGLISTAVTALFSGLIGYLGYGYLLVDWVTPFYILSAPYTPMIELLLQAPALYAYGDAVMLLMPFVFEALAILFYYFGIGWAARPASLKKSHKIKNPQPSHRSAG